MHLTASAPDVQEPILKYLVHINDIHVLDSVLSLSSVSIIRNAIFASLVKLGKK